MTYVFGYAWRGDAALQRHREAWEKVCHIEGAVLKKAPSYTQLDVVLDPAKTDGLSDLEKLVLADGGPSAFGGDVRGFQVTVFTD